MPLRLRGWLGWLLLLSALPVLAQAPDLPAASYQVTFTSVPPGAEVLRAPKTPLGPAGRPLRVDFEPGQHEVKLVLRLAGHKPLAFALDRNQASNGRPNQPLELAPESLAVAATDLVRLHPLAVGLVLAVLVGALAAGLAWVRRSRAVEARARLMEALPAPTGEGDRTGQALGSYRLVQKLGSGGMGHVYRAVPNDTLDASQAVAIKLLRDELAQAPDSLRRLRREVAILKELRHRGINQLLEFGEQQGLYFLVLGLLEGETLDRRIPSDGLELSQAQTYLEPLLEAVTYAHGKGVVHRDLKPENIMITHAGELKVLDFGLARSADLEKITQTGHEAGTPAYMSLEQMRGLEPHPAMDQYALGVIAYELVTGRRPFEGEPLQIVHDRMMSEPPPPSGFRPIPAALEEVILKMMATDAQDRYPGLPAAAAALRAAFEEALRPMGRRA